jgi:hypothetical protein
MKNQNILKKNSTSSYRKGIMLVMRFFFIHSQKQKKTKKVGKEKERSK